MSSLYVGTSGLGSSQNSINTTAHNLANVDTKGFVRQQVLQTDSRYQTIGTTRISYMQVGLGTDIAAVYQFRDSFLDNSYRQQIGRQGFYEEQFAAVEEIENVFGELEGVAFQDSIEGLWVSLQELAKEPDSIVARASLIQTSVTFLERAHNVSNQLNEYQLNLNTEIVGKVDRINEIADQIAFLNDKIVRAEAGNIENANDYRDQRNLLLDELGQLIKISYRETPSGCVTVMAEESQFITEDRINYMGLTTVNETSDMLKPVWAGLGNVDVFDFSQPPELAKDTDIGALKGLLLARGDRQGKYTDIPIRKNFDNDADYEAAVEQYNKEVSPSVIVSVQAEFDQLIHGIVTMINDTLCPNKEIELADGTRIKVLDENAPIGMDENGTAGEALFNRKSFERYSDPVEVTVRNEDGTYETKTVRIYNEEDPTDNYSLFTLGEIEVNQNIMSNYSLIPLSNNDGSGEFDIATAQALLSNWQKNFATINPNTLTESNFNDYYTNFIGEIANRGEQLKTLSTNQEDMVHTIDTQRQSAHGVSSDEELTNLIRFQHAYNASARYINVVSEMLEHIVTRL